MKKLSINPENIGFYALGNGLTVCDKSKEVNGDYKKVAHINRNRDITYYVDTNKLPADIINLIQNQALTNLSDSLNPYIKDLINTGKDDDGDFFGVLVLNNGTEYEYSIGKDFCYIYNFIFIRADIAPLVLNELKRLYKYGHNV